MVILVMGVSGAGKSTVGRRLADALGWQFSDGDEFHSPENIDKMRHSLPLTDADREPWLEGLHAAVAEWVRRGQSAVLACSVLKASYRERVASGYRNQVAVVYLKGSFEMFRQRVAQRPDHFMRQELLASQFAILEEPAEAIVVDAALPPDEIVQKIRSAIGRERD
ncbi:MAG: gluconokinase [Nitrospira sp.]|nr:gluconokinase [Nitrospira sp.]